MKGEFTYQQDTTRVKLPLESLPAGQESGTLRIKRTAPKPLQPIRTREEVAEEEKAVNAEDIVMPSQPNDVQIRYRLWQYEQDLKVGDSRYMKPLQNSSLITAEKAEADLVLPVDHVNRLNTDWLTIVLLLALILFATVRIGWSKYLGNLFQSVVNYNTSFRMFREENYSFQHGAFRLDIYFYLVFSVFLFQLNRFFRIDVSFQNFRLYLLVLAGVWSFFQVKKFLYKSTGFIFQNSGETSEFLFNLDNHVRVTGLVLFPVVAIISFSPFNNVEIPVYFGILIVTAIYFLLLFRGFMILLKKQFSIIYLFLYFCTLEILPLVLVYKFLVI